MGLLVMSSRRGFFATLAALPAVVMGRKVEPAQITQTFDFGLTPFRRGEPLPVARIRYGYSTPHGSGWGYSFEEARAEYEQRTGRRLGS